MRDRARTPPRRSSSPVPPAASAAALVEALLARGDRVVALDRVEVAARDGVRAYAVDLLDEAAVTRALDDAAAAGMASATSWRSPAARCRTRSPASTRPPCRSTCSARRSSRTSSPRGSRCAPRFPTCERRPGDRSITLTSSTDALAAYGLPAYAAAKAGLLGLVRSLAATLGADGIRINAVAPGDVPTERNVREWAHVPGWYDRLREASVLDRLGTPPDIARDLSRADRPAARHRPDHRRRRRPDASPAPTPSARAGAAGGAPMRVASDRDDDRVGAVPAPRGVEPGRARRRHRHPRPGRDRRRRWSAGARRAAARTRRRSRPRSRRWRRS